MHLCRQTRRRAEKVLDTVRQTVLLRGWLDLALVSATHCCSRWLGDYETNMRRRLTVGVSKDWGLGDRHDIF